MVESVNSLRTFLPTQLWHSVWILQCCVNLYKIFPLDCTPKVLNTLPIGLRPSPVHSWRLRNSELWPPFWPLHQRSNQRKVHRATRGRVGDETTRSLCDETESCGLLVAKAFPFSWNLAGTIRGCKEETHSSFSTIVQFCELKKESRVCCISRLALWRKKLIVC